MAGRLAVWGKGCRRPGEGRNLQGNGGVSAAGSGKHISFCYFLFLFLSHVRRILAGFAACLS